MTTRYVPPSKKVIRKNRIIFQLTLFGISVYDSWILEVRGRKSGATRRVPVSLITFEGKNYLSAGRGNTEWVRNLRAAGEGRIRLGLRRRRFQAHELPDDQKAPILRVYLARHITRIGPLFAPATPDGPDEMWEGVVANHPVFRLDYRK
ncbi:MAG: nitroreductase family deazaflavin-dependent oxidoreductase [Streptosporangiaceae bacterium]